MRDLAIYWWAAHRTRYGYVRDLVDGPHDTREEAEHAIALISAIGLKQPEHGWAVVCVEEHGVAGLALSDRDEGIASSLRAVVEAQRGRPADD